MGPGLNRQKTEINGANHVLDMIHYVRCCNITHELQRRSLLQGMRNSQTRNLNHATDLSLLKSDMETGGARDLNTRPVEPNASLVFTAASVH